MSAPESRIIALGSTPSIEALPDVDGGDHQALRKTLEDRTWDYRKPVMAPPAVYTLEGTTIATRGNICILKGPEKAGKSAVVGAAMAAAIVGDGIDCDTLGFRTNNSAGKFVLYIDCEQSAYHHAQAMQRVLKRARVTEPPEWLKACNLRSFSIPDLFRALDILLEDGAAKFGGVHSVWFDGFADLVTNVNDTESVVPAVARLMELSQQYDTVIFGVVHQNPGATNDKARGVMGSELQRKVETVLAVAPEGSGHVIYTAKARNKNITKDDGVRYQWDTTAGMFMTDGQSKAIAQAKRRQELIDLAARVLPDGASSGHDALKKSIMDALSISDGGAKRWIRELRDEKVIQKGSDQKYVRTSQH